MMKIVEIVKKNKTIWLLGIFMGIFFSGVNALGRYLNGAASEGLPGILRTFFLWFPVAFGVSSLLLAGIRRGADWISGTWLNKISVEILNGKKSFWIGWGVFSTVASGFAGFLARSLCDRQCVSVPMVSGRKYQCPSSHPSYVSFRLLYGSR